MIRCLPACPDLSPSACIDEASGIICLPPSFMELLLCQYPTAWLQDICVFPKIDLVPLV